MSNPYIVTYKGNTYDIEHFIESHPAGSAVIEPFRDKDITEAFDSVGHSNSAIRLMNKYKTLSNSIVEVTTTTPLSTNKLFTKEDPYHFHKLFGLFSLVSFAYRYLYVLWFTGNLGFTGSYFDIFTLLSHWILSSSSLLFHVLDKRIIERPLIIYEEYRLHAILFTTRAIMVSLIGIYTIDMNPNIRQSILLLTLASIHNIVDYVTKKYGTVGVTTVRNNNDGNYKYIRLFYSYYQICALGSLISIDSNLCNLGFNTIVAIQSSSFLMTLKRKSIIRWKSHMIWYSFALLLSYIVIWRTKGTLFFIHMAVLFFFRCQFNMNKYLLWSCYVLLSSIL